MRTKKKRKKAGLEIFYDQVCGIDVGSKFHVYATGLEESDLGQCGVYTDDINKLIKKLKSKQIEYVVMESTGSYWQFLFNSLQQAGFKVKLVDGKQTKHYKKKTDYKDARAIYQLFRLGFLDGCFLPDSFTRELQLLYRHRIKIVEDNSKLSNRIQKSLRLMNFRIEVVLNDVMGMSGRAIIEAIIEGKTCPKYLASLVSKRARKTKEEFVKACTGQFDKTQVFLLEDNYTAYHRNLERIQKVDDSIKQKLEDYVEDVPPLKGKKKQIGKNQINIGLQDLAYRYYDVDLFQIECVSYNLVMSLIGEVGHGITTKFATAKEFTSWLRLAPNNKISGGKILSSRTPKGMGALAKAFRNAANTISNSKTGYLKSFFTRIAVRKGRGAAITATARKIAVIVWYMIKNKEEYRPPDEQIVSVQIKRKIIKNIQAKMKRLNIEYEEISLAL